MLQLESCSSFVEKSINIEKLRMLLTGCLLSVASELGLCSFDPFNFFSQLYCFLDIECFPDKLFAQFP